MTFAEPQLLMKGVKVIGGSRRCGYIKVLTASNCAMKLSYFYPIVPIEANKPIEKKKVKRRTKGAGEKGL